MAQTTTLGKDIVHWLFDRLVYLYGICCVFITVGWTFDVIISSVTLLAFYITVAFAGTFLIKYTPLLDTISNIKESKSQLWACFFVSMFTIGTIFTSTFLIVNTLGAGKEEHQYNARITDKQGPHTPKGLYRPEYDIDFLIMGQIKSTDFDISFRDVLDTATFVHVTYRKGLFGYVVMTGYRLE